jgi:exodeoxyribonuclease-1
MANSFYWHDYETWGADPARHRPAQFAGLRSDQDLNPIGEPLVLFSKPSNDVLPHPEACLITRLTPQQAFAKGLPEAEFIGRIHQELIQPDTCAVGYNNIRFDDEVTRYTLYRNFFDPYAREWQDGNSRWDLLDVMRMAHALRPDGIEWPQREDGTTSFRLEDMSAANGIAHASAHDALSDVRATLALARLLKQAQPKLFDYALTLRHKQQARNMLDQAVAQQRPLLHVSSKIAAELGCIAPVMPLAQHPTNRNAVIVVDLRDSPADWLDLAVEQIRQRIFTRADELPEGVRRLPLKSIHVNKSPMLAPLTTLSPETAARWRIDLNQAMAHASLLLAAPGLADKLQAVFRQPQAPARDVDLALYGAFLKQEDQPLMEIVRNASPEELARLDLPFRDKRLPTLLFRYRARNWPESLAPTERALWDIDRKKRFKEGDAVAGITLQQYQTRLNELLRERQDVEADVRLLHELQAWSQTLGI